MNTRRADLAKIHIAKKQLGLDDETYRAMLFEVAGVSSSADLDDKGRDTLLRHMERVGAKFESATRSRKVAGYPGKPAKMTMQLEKVEALLADMKMPWSYVNSMCKHMFGVDRIQWCKSDQLQPIIAALVVEQKKRNSLAAQVKEMLTVRPLDEQAIIGLIGAKDAKIWRRNRQAMKRLVKAMEQM